MKYLLPTFINSFLCQTFCNEVEIGLRKSSAIWQVRVANSARVVLREGSFAAAKAGY